MKLSIKATKSKMGKSKINAIKATKKSKIGLKK
jgi:hypothetical protein